jgi:hypothetical protein
MAAHVAVKSSPKRLAVQGGIVPQRRRAEINSRHVLGKPLDVVGV